MLNLLTSMNPCYVKYSDTKGFSDGLRTAWCDTDFSKVTAQELSKMKMADLTERCYEMRSICSYPAKFIGGAATLLTVVGVAAIALAVVARLVPNKQKNM